MITLHRLLVLLAFLYIGLFANAADVLIDEIACLRNVADSLHSVGRTDSAIVVGSRAIELAEQSGDAVQIVGTNAAQGVFLRSTGRVDEALEHYRKALDIVTSDAFRDNPDQEAIEEIASLYINLAVLNLDMAHKDEASKYAIQAADWTGRSHDAGLRSQIFGVVGSVLTGAGELQQAMKYQTLSYDNALESGNDEAAFRSAAYTMLLSDRLGDKASVNKWREKCVDMMPEIESTMARLLYYQVECSIHLRNGEQAEAIGFFKKILALDNIESLPFIQYDCYNNMHLAYADLGEYKEAYATLLKGNEVRDSLYEHEKAESLRDLTVKYETKETELALVQSEARRAGVLMWLMVALVLILVLVMSFLIYVSRQRRQRLEREMEFASLRADIGRRLTQQYVEGLENERERMARELHDGICNDLLAIRMNMDKGVPEDITTKLIDSCRESVRRISHELMPPEFAYASIDEVIRYYIGKLSEANAGKVSLSYSSSPVAAPWSSVGDNVALETYRIVQEAVGNALKHSGAGEVKVSMSLEEKMLRVIVEDNGSFGAGGRRGIGLSSMNRRAASINGEIKVEHPGQNGTRITFTVVL